MRCISFNGILVANNATHCNTPQHTATHRNTLQHTATHCNTPNPVCCSALYLFQWHSRCHQCNPLQNTATPRFQCLVVCCSVWLCVAVCLISLNGMLVATNSTHCNTLQHTATPCNTLQHTALHCITLQHPASHCNTLQHTATHCDTLHLVNPECCRVLQRDAVCCSVLFCLSQWHSHCHELPLTLTHVVSLTHSECLSLTHSECLSRSRALSRAFCQSIAVARARTHSFFLLQRLSRCY